MNKFSGKFETLHEETLFKYQQGGFLMGDYVGIIDDFKKAKSFKKLNPLLRTEIEAYAKDETVFRISCIKSNRSEAMSGPVGAANVPGTLWADIYVEYAPGMWNNVLTVPLDILGKLGPESEGEGYLRYNRKLIRPNNIPSARNKTTDNQTQSDKRNLPDRHKKLEFAPYPKDGREQTKLKENISLDDENALMYESYVSSLQ